MRDQVRAHEVRETHHATSTPKPPPFTGLERPVSPGFPVPFITRWSSERAFPVRVVERYGRLAYTDERSIDRDSAGVLWRRVPSTPGKGKPLFGAVHAIRQRAAMAGLRCQVCGGPADRNEHGILWLIGEDRDAPGSWPQGLETAHPPICRPCVALSLRGCPHLRRKHVALRVRRCTPAGIYGAFYRPGFPYPVLTGANGVPYHTPAAHWIIASQLVMRLDHFTRTDIGTELAAVARGE